MVETETSLKVKCLRSDNGGEYIDGGFSEYCATQGIRMEKTIPGTPQQNGVAERMNRTLNERARSMRLHAGLPKTFWADAVSTAGYLINRGPSVPMEFRLPEEVWRGKEVKFSHLKVFGCVSYVHIDSDARSKLDAKSKICFFIGYGDEKFDYRSIVTSDVIEIDQKKSEFVNLDELTENLSRNIRPLQRYSPILNYLLLTDGGEPECYDETLQDENSSKWELAMKDEMDSLLGNQTWELTELPVGKKALHNKWHSFHGDLEEDLYMIQLEGFIVQGQENLVCKLRKSLYGLKQAPRQWYKKFDNFMHRIGFKRCEADHCCYVKSFDNSYIILLLIWGAAKQILGMRIIRDKANGTLKLSQLEYVKKVLSRFNMNEAKQPDIAHAVGVVSRFMSRPGKQHWEAKSTTGFVFTLGGTAISWTSNLQKIVTLSTTEAEYVAATEAGKEMIWLHGFLDELGKKQEMGILHSDSQSAIFLAKNSAFHSKSKHIQTKYHFIRYLVEDKLVILEKICGSKNPADMLTKGVTIEKLKLCAASIGLLA
ncbi:Retrovirus-related Pol polyprotein from transposon TNT 1-94 [Vitis vinifera]|uniref:Retrovirus-related Pol polyprotein from transposon TNT 1-94 n=1 Tax=Vitis vinifera TaxID=29760 RepID=A0A438FSC3_VITVI|nr:Retrovirus-related Pol polyprotein from transposon TNT 1-94 [Vitis vinifera]